MALRRPRHPVTLLLLALLAPFSACGGDGGSESPTDPETPGGNEDQTVVITLTSDLRFSPSDVTISTGTTVRWVNAGNVDHTVTPDGHSEWTEWQTGLEGETFEHTFDAQGTFAFYCVPHRALGMTGVIRVQ